MNQHANEPANRLEEGANQLLAFAEGLSQAEWETICPNKKRSIGVLVHYVASAYLVEEDLNSQAGKNGAKSTAFPEAFISGCPDRVWIASNGISAILGELYRALVENAVTSDSI